jgi:holo-[acyl-carrier protein] synthase
MILGVGIDNIEVGRVAAKIEKEQGFRELVFCAAEISYCESKAHKYQHYAARFAAKEAFFKAMGTGWTNGTAFNEIEVVHDEHNRPGLRLTGATASWAGSLGAGTISLSLSHLAAIASAMVVIEKQSS